MKLKSQSGSILLTTLSFIILLAIAAASILELTMNSYKLTMRNEMRAQARTVAESELENVWYQWVSQIMGAVPASDTPQVLFDANIADLGNDPTTDRDAFLVAHQDQRWIVRRSVGYDPTYDFFEGMLDEETQGKVTYVTVRIEVLPNDSSYFRNELAVRVGRRFATTNASIFQYGVFYQGDLEMAPGNDITIDGSVTANGSIYMGSTNPGRLTLNRKVKYLSGHYFNSDSTLATVLRKPNTPLGGTLIAPIFGTSQSSQVSDMDAPVNLLGGLDPLAIMSQRSDLFATENDVYRAAILPPPALAPEEYPTYNSSLGDDPTINASRMYSRAGIRVTVNTDNTVTFTKGDGTVVTTAYSGDIIDPDNTLLNYGPIVVGSANTDMYDLREGKNIKTTTINMQALIKAVQFNFPTGSDDFNGAIYFHVKASDATTPRAVKLTHAEDVSGRKGLGTTVTTNGGLYVQGDYNTLSAPLPDGTTNVAMLMADQITVLSNAWDDANAANADLTSRTASGDIHINAGILTGNTSATSTEYSGGAQNLVRYLENWNGYSVNVYGSLGRLFESKTFHSYFKQPGMIYGKPSARNFVFDSNLIKHPPAGSPTTTKFQRGSFFVWNR